jgi:hypothetical protein
MPPIYSIEGVLLLFELAFLCCIIFNFSRLRKYGLTIILPLVVGGAIFDVFIYNLNLHKIYSNYNTIEITCLILAIRFSHALKKYRLELMIAVILLYLIVNVIAGIYQSKGAFNNHLWNIYYLLAAPLYYTWFFRLLRLKNRWATAYLSVSLIFIALFVFEFVTNNHLKRDINLFTVINFNLHSIILSTVVIIQLIASPSSLRLHLEPCFWILAGLIINGVINAIEDSMHSYLTFNQEQLPHFYFLFALSEYSRNFLDFCFFVSIALCVRKYQIEKSTEKVGQ